MTEIAGPLLALAMVAICGFVFGLLTGMSIEPHDVEAAEKMMERVKARVAFRETKAAFKQRMKVLHQ